MNFKLDLKKFKKIASDKHTTTMRHENGHEIKIAHNSLSPKLRGQLASLPQAEPMAKGGEVPPPAEESPGVYKSYVQPAFNYVTDAISSNLDRKQQTAADTTAILKDKARMMDPNMQGPQQPEGGILPAEQQYAQDALGFATQGTIGAKSAPYMKNITAADIEAGIEKGGGRAGRLAREAAEAEFPAVQPKLSPEAAKEAELLRQARLKQAITPGDGPAPMAEGGEVHEEEKTRQKKLENFEKGAKASGWNPEQWAKNIKEGLGMANGGEVPKEEMAPEPSMGRNPMTQVEAAPAPQQQQPTIIINNGPQPQQQPQQPTMAEHVGSSLRGAIGDARDAVRNAGSAISGAAAPIIDTAGEFKRGFVGGQQAEAQKEMQQGQVPAGLQQPMPEGPATTKPLPPAPGPEDPYGTKAAQDVFNQGFGQKLGGIQEAANLAGKVAKQNEAIYNEQLQKQAEVQKQFQENYKKYQEDHDNIMHDIQANHISPDNYWKDHSKLLTGLGIILAGFNPSDKPNAALDFLNKQMERNLDAQKAEMGKRNNLLSALQHQYGDSVTATTMFNTIQRGMIADKLQQIANQNGGAQAQATAKQLAGELKMQNAQQIGQNAMRATMLKSGEGAPGNNPDAAIQQQLHAMRIANPAMAKEIEARYIPSVGMASIPVPEKVRATIQERKVLGESIDQLINFQKKYGGTLAGITDPQIKNQGEALAKQVQDQYRRANDQGVFKESEAAFVNGVIADSPSSLFSKYTKAPGYRTAAQINQQNLNAAYSAVGLKPFNGNAMPAAGQSYTPKTFKPSK